MYIICILYVVIIYHKDDVKLKENRKFSTQCVVEFEEFDDGSKQTRNFDTFGVLGPWLMWLTTCAHRWKSSYAGYDSMHVVAMALPGPWSILRVGGPAWGSALRIKSHRCKLECTYRQMCLRVAIAYRTASHDAFCVITCMVPIGILIREGIECFEMCDTRGIRARMSSTVK